jgi:hypothetical protein
MRKAKLINHVVIVIVIISLFFFQIAILVALMRQRDDRNAWKIYERSTTNSEAEAVAM